MLQVSRVSEIIWIIFVNLYYLMLQLKYGLQLLQWKKKQTANKETAAKLLSSQERTFLSST